MLIRWQHTGARLAVLWSDGADVHRTEVCPVTLERLDGEPLANGVDAQLADDLHRLERGIATHYAGVTA